MRPFDYASPTTADQVPALLGKSWGEVEILAGGSDLLGELKDDVVHYERLVSLAGIKALRDVHQDETGLHFGSLVTLAQLEHDPRLQGPYHILAEAARGVNGAECVRDPK